METNTLVCYIEMFDKTQSVVMPTGGEARIATEDISSWIPAVCYTHDIPKVHFFGNEDYIAGIVQQINEYEKITYGKNDLRIEVN